MTSTINLPITAYEGFSKPTLYPKGGFMSSLKGYIPALARLLGMQPTALYERQRALVRAGLLDMSTGHGPGSGTRANVPSAAIMLLAAMASDRLTDTAERTLEIAHLEPEGGGRCPFTGASTFLTALYALLRPAPRKKHQSQSLLGLYVSRTAPRAGLLYREYTDLNFTEMPPDPRHIVVFAKPGAKEPPLSKFATLDIGVVDKIAADLAAIAGQPEEGEADD